MKLGVAKFAIVVSDLWGYPPSWTPPYTNWTAWDAHCSAIATASLAYPNVVIFDIWNEPNGGGFWVGTFDQFMQTFSHCHDAIRSRIPNAVISGPSVSAWSPMVESFVQGCQNYSIVLDALSWHEFPDDAQIPSIATHLAEAMSLMQTYPSVGIKEYHVNEIISYELQVLFVLLFHTTGCSKTLPSTVSPWIYAR